jgi:GT2 family glycosyltransferase
MLQASILVVSRTPDYLNRLLSSLDQAYGGPAESIEVIASWNGSAVDEQRIQSGRLPFQILQRDPYHFAGNMNNLARRAQGSILIFANDDLIADPNSIDAAIERLQHRPDVGIVGARLRTSGGQLAHAGIHFTSYGSPYHQLEGFADAEHATNGRERLVPAVTGAFFAMRRDDFLAIGMDEFFKVCGEDVLLNLQARKQLHKQVLFCPAMGGVHDAESTRRHTDGQGANADDMQRMRQGWLTMIQQAEPASLMVELHSAQDEAEDLRNRCRALMEEKQELIDKIAETARQTKQHLEHSLLAQENKRLRAQLQQLRNQLANPLPTAPTRR